MPITYNRPKPPAGCLWAPEAAEYLGVALSTLRKWRQRPEAIAAGRPQGFLPGGKRRAYELAKLDAYLAKQKAVEDEPNQEMRPAEPRIPTQRRRNAA